MPCNTSYLLLKKPEIPEISGFAKILFQLIEQVQRQFFNVRVNGVDLLFVKSDKRSLVVC